MPANITFRLRHNLSTLLRERNVTAAHLSRQTGVAKQVLSDWMSGVQPRKIEHLYLVAKELGVSMESLCFSKSDTELLSTKNFPNTENLQISADPIGQSIFSNDEIRGRFEIHLRRI